MNRIIKFVASALIATLVVACGGGSSSAPPSVNVTGEWKGTARSVKGGTGPISFSLNQVGADVGGSASSPYNNCLKVAVVSGSVSGNEVTGSITAGGEKANYKVTIVGNAMSGTYEAVSAICGNDSGSLNMTR